MRVRRSWREKQTNINYKNLYKKQKYINAFAVNNVSVEKYENINLYLENYLYRAVITFLFYLVELRSECKVTLG